MTTTTGEARPRDPELALQALHVLASTDIPFAVLHNEERIASGNFASDVDLICDIEFAALIEHIASLFRAAGIRPILAWPYDTGSTALFISNADATRGAHLDFLWDRTGRGKYGLDVGQLFAGVERGITFPRISPLHELLYLARKRQIKEQWEECRWVLDQLSEMSGAASEVRHIFVGSVSDEVRKLMEGELLPAEWRLRRIIADVSRTLGRIRRPAGAWVEIIGSEQADTVAQAVAKRFGGLLPHVGWGRRPSSPAIQLKWFSREVAPIRWRAGIYVSWTHQEARPAAGLQVCAGESLDSSIKKVVEWLEQRLLS